MKRERGGERRARLRSLLLASVEAEVQPTRYDNTDQIDDMRDMEVRASPAVCAFNTVVVYASLTEDGMMDCNFVMAGLGFLPPPPSSHLYRFVYEVCCPGGILKNS